MENTKMQKHKKMHVVLINSYYHPNEPGGAERSVRNLAEGLVALGHRVSVIALGEKRHSYHLNGVAIEQLPIRNRYLPLGRGHDGGLGKLKWHARDSYNRAAGRDIEALLRQLQPDLVHSHNLGGFSVAAWAAVKRLGLPLVHTTRDFYLLCPKTTMQGRGDCSCTSPCLPCRPFAWPRHRASRLVDHVVGISQFILKRHLDNGYFPTASSSVIYNGYDAPAVTFKPPGNVFTLGFIGRLAPAKGVGMLLEALALLVAANSPVELLIAGEGDDDYVGQLKKQAENLPVKFVGHQQPADFFRQIDIAVVPSIWNEPLGRVVIEAMANGKPVVATPVGGIPEILANGGGVLSRDTTPLAFSTSLTLIIDEMLSAPELWHKYALQIGRGFSSFAIAHQYVTMYFNFINDESSLKVTKALGA